MCVYIYIYVYICVCECGPSLCCLDIITAGRGLCRSVLNMFFVYRFIFFLHFRPWGSTIKNLNIKLLHILYSKTHIAGAAVCTGIVFIVPRTQPEAGQVGGFTGCSKDPRQDRDHCNACNGRRS